MVEVHDPLRLMVVIEQKVEFVEKILKGNPRIAAWYQLDWMRLAVIDPESKKTFLYQGKEFEEYTPFTHSLERTMDFDALFESSSRNLPVSIFN